MRKPHDGGQRLRPHSISGWWQIWSGGICIALLSPEDVAPIVEATLLSDRPTALQSKAAELQLSKLQEGEQASASATSGT